MTPERLPKKKRRASRNRLGKTHRVSGKNAGGGGDHEKANDSRYAKATAAIATANAGTQGLLWPVLMLLPVRKGG